MRELMVTLKFTKDCLGNVKDNTSDRWPVYKMPTMPDGRVRFESNWWRANIKFAADVLCRHHKSVEKIHFDIAIDGQPDCWHKRYFDSKRYIKHLAFSAGSTIVIRCVVPNEISDEDFKQLMELIGRFKGISPFGPREYGFFTVISVQRSLGHNETEDIQGRSDAADQAYDAQGPTATEQPVEIHSTTSLDD